MIIMPPSKLLKYIAVDENGEWFHDPNMPENLKPVYEEFLKEVEDAKAYKENLK